MAEIKLFADVTMAIKDKVFAEDLMQIVVKSLDKIEMNRLAHESAQVITETGDFDPLREFVTMKRLAYYLDELMANIKPAALQEAIKYTAGGRIKSVSVHNAGIMVKKGVASWQYPPCVELDQIDAKIGELKKQAAAIKALLQRGSYIDTVTGEEIPQALCVQGGEETFAVTI